MCWSNLQELYGTIPHNTSSCPQNGCSHESLRKTMATVSGSRTSIVTTNSSSSGPLQLAQSSDNAQAPIATIPTPLAAANNHRADAMAQSSRPAPGQAMQRPSSSTDTPVKNHGTTSIIGLGTPELSELASNPLLASILRPNKDGRVKNPVPSKLKGKTDYRKGNFSVMHMGTTPGKKNDAGKDAAAERDAAARRTSENTASRAKAAQQEKYVPPRRRGLEAEETAAVNGGSPFTPSRDDQKQRGRPLAPDETKFEQARLLTLLRTLNPVTVVDQICKAVAYFGGIPGAPPPENGIFPESANTKETGALFIGWLAEIFPDLSSLGVQRMQDAPGGSQNPIPIGVPVTQLNEPPNPRNGFGYGQAVSAPVWGLPQASLSANPNIPNISPEPPQPASAAPTQNPQSEQPHPATPAKQPPQEAPPPSTSTSKRGRGRPKGSKNKGKSDTQNTGERAGPGGPDTASQNRSFVSEQSHGSPVAYAATAKASQSEVPQMQTRGDQTSGPKQPQATRYIESSWQSKAQKTQADSNSSVIPASVDELSPEERAVLEAFRQQDASEAAKAAALNSVSIQGPAGAGQKRKRPTPKPKSVAAPPNQPSEQTKSTPNMSGTLISSNDRSMSIAGDALNWVTADNSTPNAPPAKRQRQRKSKAPGVNEPSQSQTASAASNTTPPVAAHAVPDLTSTASQQIPPPRPPAEGLEAHYEKFASRPQQLPQQNGTSQTPSVGQQQQLRQQKPPSVAPQQKPAPVSQQQQKPATQMQQQKSQQGSQRDDQKTSQGASARSSSTGFYNQRSHGSFSNQYPSNQASQLYGTNQPSPQLGTASNNSSSYRAANTHGLRQASPQFPQADGYSTASPRTLSQSSPTFSHADSNFRSSSAHSISQPSPTYAQAEKIYRAANTQSITKPSSSFSRTHNQSQPGHQSHYNHFGENPYADLPALDNLSHSGSSGHAGVTLNTGSFGQTVGGALSTSSRAGSSSLYGTTNQSVFDSAGTSEQLLRAASRPSGSNGVYGTSSGLGGVFEQGTSDQELRERLMRNIGRR